MCGIAGVVGTEDPALIEKMVAALHHRGPDMRGICSRRTTHLGATRLTIIDPGAGAQPTYNETGRLCLVFNGEIYNHRELRADLRRKGHVFSSETDTEVVIHLYEECGDDCVRHLRGMFAFAILDGERLFLARDRLGIKPLYYAFIPQHRLFLFGSEIKAILQCRELTPRLDMQAFADSVVLGFPTRIDTYIEGVKSLAAGHTMTVICGDEIALGRQQRYWEHDFVRDEGKGLEESQRALEEALRDAIETHLAADVEVGLTISGGLDSTVLALLASEQRDQPLWTFTVADQEHHPELEQARIVAAMTGARHFPIILGFDEYLEAIPGYIVAAETPDSLAGLPFYALCHRITQHVKACMHGEGADEVFGGYRDYLDRRSNLSGIRRRLPLLKQLGVLPSERVLEIVDALSTARLNDYLCNIFEINRSEQLEMYHLGPVDKCSMSASVEMRVPYLDDNVVRTVGSFPLRHLVRTDIGIRKYILRRLCLGRFGPKVTDIVLREKLGFPSSGVHLLHRFDELCNTILPDDFLTRHEFGHCFSSKRELLIFELFSDIFLTHRGNDSEVGDIMHYMKARASQSSRATRKNSHAPTSRPDRLHDAEASGK